MNAKFLTGFSAALLVLTTSVEAKNYNDCERMYTEANAAAIKVCEPMAEQGDAVANRVLGNMHYFGWMGLVKRDFKKAEIYFKKAGLQNETEAKYSLGVMYERGEGMDVDYNRAIKWYKSAAADGHAFAQFNLANMYAKGAGTQKSDSLAVKWYLAAANQGEPNSQYNLGNRYALGKGVASDLEESYKWYTLAYTNGIQEAMPSRDMIVTLMTPEQITRGEYLASQWKPEAYSAKAN